MFLIVVFARSAPAVGARARAAARTATGALRLVCAGQLTAPSTAVSSPAADHVRPAVEHALGALTVHQRVLHTRHDGRRSNTLRTLFQLNHCYLNNLPGRFCSPGALIQFNVQCECCKWNTLFFLYIFFLEGIIGVA